MGPRKRAKPNLQEQEAAKDKESQQSPVAVTEAHQAPTETSTSGNPASSIVLAQAAGSKTDASSIKTVSLYTKNTYRGLI